MNSHKNAHLTPKDLCCWWADQGRRAAPESHDAEDYWKMGRSLPHAVAPAQPVCCYYPEFGWQRLARWAERHGGVRLLERRAMPPLGHFSLIRFGRLSAGADGRGRAGADGGQYGRRCIERTA